MFTTIIDAKDVQHLLEKIGPDQIMDELIAEMHKAFWDFDPNAYEIPVRDGFNYTQPYMGLVEWMPSFKKEDEVIIKMVGYHPQNPEKHNLPTILSTVQGYDPNTGHLEFIMDGILLTAMRTGAASAIATKALCDRDTIDLGMIGCGAQSVTQIHAISRIKNINRVLFYDVDPTVQNSLPDRISPLNLDIKLQPSDIQDIVENSDVVCTATSVDPGAGPLFNDSKTRDHLHINAVGADFPGKVELPTQLLSRSYVIPDYLEQALKEGECQQMAIEKIGKNIVEVIKEPELQKELHNRTTVFDSTGWAFEDFVASQLFKRYAEDLNIGSKIQLEAIPEDQKNPYGLIIQNENISQF